MALSSVVICGFSSLILIICGCLAQKNDTLLMVQILYRHGDRSPAKTFPTNPLPESAWPQGFGQLTTVGMIQHFELGKYFRRRYIEGEPFRLLNSSYSRYEVRLRSTDYDRTLMSAYSNLAGLYPPSGDQIWNKELLWQPIPVHTVPKDTDYLLKVDVECPKYDEYYEAALNSDEIKKEEAANQEFYRLLENKTGNRNESLTTAWDVYDPIFCARTHGLLEPSWANMTWKGQTVFDKLSFINSLQFDVQFNRPGESRLRGGPLLKEMIENMQSRMSEKSKFKSHIYSASCLQFSVVCEARNLCKNPEKDQHDNTVSAFLSALKVFNGIAPPYRSSVLVELHKIDGKHEIRILYLNDTTREPYTLQIPGCSSSCLFDEFVRITKDNIPGDIHAECQTKSMSTSNFMLLLGMVIILVSFLLVTILVYAVLRKRGRHKGYVAYDGLIARDDEPS